MRPFVLLLGGLSMLWGVPASAHIGLPIRGPSGNAAEDHLYSAAVECPVIVKARVDSVCRPQELWLTEGTYDRKPNTYALLYTPVRIAPAEYWKGEGPATPYRVYLEGGHDPISGKDTFLEPFAPRRLKPGRVVVLFLFPMFADSVRDPSPLPPSTVDEKHRESLLKHGSPPKPRPGPSATWQRPVPIPLEERIEGVAIVAAGDGYWVDEQYAYADPVGVDSPFRDKQLAVADFRSAIGRAVSSLAPESLSASGCWREITVTSISPATSPGEMRVFGWPVSRAQWVSARVLWSCCAAGDTITFLNPTGLATGWSGKPGKDPWEAHLRALAVGDHRLVCLREEAGEERVIGGENGVLSVAEGAARRWAVAAEGKLVKGSVPLADMKARLARGGR